MSVASFFDTNVLLYTLDDVDQRKRGIANALIVDAIAADNGCISYQVIQETLNVLTRKLTPAMTSEDKQGFVDRMLLPLWRVMPSAGLFREGLSIQDRYRFSFYDSMIVAAALSAGCRRLYSEDLQHGQKIGKLEIVNPFAI